MIKTECLIRLDEIKYISIVCKNCKTEMRLSLSHEFSGICPSCATRMNKMPVNELINCIHDMQHNESVKSNIPDITFISDEKENR